MHVAHDVGRDAFLAQLQKLLTVLDQLPERDFWAASRCRGWCVADVVTHVHVGLQEMVLGVVSPTTAAVDTDAASYWAGSSPEGNDHAELDHLSFVRRLCAAHASPSTLLDHLRPTAAALNGAVAAMAAGRVSFQGRVMGTGDFLTTWAVELVVHQLDLGRELDLEAPDSTALALARQTVEALAGMACPPGWSDEQVVLLGTGRVSATADDRAGLPELVGAMPVLG